MDIALSPNQLRVIGCLLEKESTTPDAYPLTLNSLMTACNQKTNRDPVLNLSVGEVKRTLDELLDSRLVMEEAGARTNKYKHRFCNTRFGGLQLSEQERGIICVLFLRGPQTPGELRARTNRLCSFDDVSQTEQVLQQMVERELVVQMPRESGRRESRFAHCLGDTPIEMPAAPAPSRDSQRIEELEQEIARLRAENEHLRRELAALRG